MPIPLCVSYSARAQAAAAGAIWDGTEKAWMVDENLVQQRFAELRPFLPRMYRPDRTSPYVRPHMVPQTSWGKNLRAVLSADDWKRVQTHAYDTAGRRCIVCGGRGPKWPVEADEAWDLDDRTGTQTLKGVIALCPDCHLVRHWGQATISGRIEVALSQMMRVNKWTRAQAQAAGRAGMDVWQTRSRRHWAIDYSWVTRTHGIQIAAGGLEQADAVNRDLVAQAEARAGGADGMPSWLRHLVG